MDITDGGSAARPYKQSRWLSESGTQFTLLTFGIELMHKLFVGLALISLVSLSFLMFLLPFSIS